MGWSRIALLLAVPLLIYVVGAAGLKALEAYQLRQDADRLRREIVELQTRNADLRRQIEYLRTDAYVEKAAREELHLVKPGETATVMVGPPDLEPGPLLASVARGGDTPTRDVRPTWRRWQEFFHLSGQPSAVSRQP